MSWWTRTKPTPPTTNYNPATDEVSLDRCVRRLNEILDEFGPIGRFLETTGELAIPGPDLEKRLGDGLEQVRIPGFCGHKLVAEAWTLMELIVVRVIAIRKLYADSGNVEKLRKLEKIQAFAEEIEPKLREAEHNMEVYSSLDSKTQLESLIKRWKAK